MFKRVMRAKKVFTFGVLAVLIIPSFVLFFHGSSSQSRPGPGGIAGTIFGRPVPWDTFQEEYRLAVRSVEAKLGVIPKNLEPLLQEQTWNRFILKEEARHRVRVTDEELARFIQSQPLFQQRGRFDATLYYRLLAGLRLTPRAYEEQMRDELRVQKLLDAVAAQVRLTEDEVRSAYAASHERLRVAMILVAPATFEQQAKQAVTSEALHNYYTAHQEALRRPAQRVIDYIGMTPEDASKQLGPIREDAMHAYSAQHREESTRADGSVKPLEETREVIRQRLQEERLRKYLTTAALDLEDDVEAGVRFEEIAASRSLPVRRIGPVERAGSNPVKELPTAVLGEAFEVPVGSMTRVVQTTGGVWLLKPVEELPAHLPTFEDVHDEIRKRAVQERARELAQADARRLRTELSAQQAQGLTFEEARLRLGLNILHPEPFTLQDTTTPLGDHPSVIAALSNLTLGALSEVLDTPSGLALVTVEERLPFDQAQFTQDKVQFHDSLLKARQEEHLARYLESLRATARLKSYVEQTN